MRAGGKTVFNHCVLLALSAFALTPSAWSYGPPSSPQVSQQTATPGQVIRSVGTIKAINGTTITLTPDTGSELNILVQDATRVVRIPPGETTLKNAAPAQLQDLQAGDRILVGGKLADDSKSLNASTIVVMKRSDVTAKQQHDREDWQKRGLGGLVSAVDAASGAITISQPSLGASKVITIHTTKSTIVRRYAPDSVKFENATPSTLADIKPGDQLRARGARSADGSELDADEIVSGRFRNLAGTVVSADAAANTITVLDLATKKSVVVRVTTESQLRKLPAPMAQRLAMRLNGGTGGTANGAGAPTAPANPGAQPSTPSSGSPASGGPAERQRANGSPDLQQILARMPAVGIADLQKGDAVMIVSTEGTDSGGVTAITLLAGVEPLLQSKGSQAMILSPWSLGGAPGGDAESQ
jgi:uncharacterized protein YciI